MKKIRLGVRITQYVTIEVPNNYNADYRNLKHRELAKRALNIGGENFQVIHCNNVKPERETENE